MLDIAEHIEYLLLRHDCVVVPGLGAFLVNDTHAYYDSKTCRFCPPMRSLCFNSEVRHNDGLLVSSISRKEGMSIDSVRIALENEVTAMRHQLDITGEIAMGNLGVLHRGSTPDSPVFEPSTYSLTSFRYAGLKPLDLMPIVKEPVPINGEEESSSKILTIPTPLKIVASIVVIMVVLGLLYSTTGLVRHQEMTFASLDSGISSKMDTALPVGVAIDSTFEPALSREIELNILCPSIESESNEIIVADNCDNYFNDNDRYILVVASFPSHRAAVRHINGDQSLRIIEMDGNYRVYVATSPTIQQARTMASTVSSQYPSVWVCKR